MKEIYEEPIFEIIELEATDIIVTSYYSNETNQGADTEGFQIP